VSQFPKSTQKNGGLIERVAEPQAPLRLRAMRARWEHELRQYEYSLGRPAVAVASTSAIFSHELTID
jgi:hypothetical protein